VIVTDERIETIVDAVIEGRAMWASVRDAVAVLVGGTSARSPSRSSEASPADARR
jgi:hypothetical protein